MKKIVLAALAALIPVVLLARPMASDWRAAGMAIKARPVEGAEAFRLVTKAYCSCDEASTMEGEMTADSLLACASVMATTDGVTLLMKQLRPLPADANQCISSGLLAVKHCLIATVRALQAGKHGVAVRYADAASFSAGAIMHAARYVGNPDGYGILDRLAMSMDEFSQAVKVRDYSAAARILERFKP